MLYIVVVLIADAVYSMHLNTCPRNDDRMALRDYIHSQVVKIVALVLSREVAGSCLVWLVGIGVVHTLEGGIVWLLKPSL